LPTPLNVFLCINTIRNADGTVTETKIPYKIYVVTPNIPGLFNLNLKGIRSSRRILHNYVW
jgi:hypothetical protein